jgi:hypothetical protein
VVVERADPLRDDAIEPTYLFDERILDSLTLVRDHSARREGRYDR